MTALKILEMRQHSFRFSPCPATKLCSKICTFTLCGQVLTLNGGKSLEEKYNALKNKLLNAVQILACAGSVMLILSPVFQWIERIILYYTKSGVLYSSGAVDAERESVAVYQEMMLSLENIIFFMSKMILGALLLCLILNFEKVKKNWKKYLRAAMPLLIFSAYSVGIFIVTQIRGYSAYDLAVHPYRGSTMYDFMKYPFTYFLCGMLVSKGKYRKIVIYTFSLSSIVINSSALIHKWVVPNPCFNGWKSSGIFNNPNHFGYYLQLLWYVMLCFSFMRIKCCIRCSRERIWLSQ
jgi:hypothetical protein